MSVKRLAQFPEQSMSGEWQLLLENMNGNESLQGERTYLKGGLRLYGGPRESAQPPVQVKASSVQRRAL